MGSMTTPDQDHSSGDGNTCYVTGVGVPEDSVALSDVDGETILVSPLLDLSAEGEYFIQFWWGYFTKNDTATGELGNTFTVEISNDAGKTWEEVLATDERTGGWARHRFRVPCPTDSVQIRFVAADGIAAGSNLVDAVIDDVLVERFPTPPVFLRGDFDGNGEVKPLPDGLQLLDYGFTAGSEPPCFEAADVNGNNKVDGDTLADALYLFRWGFLAGFAPPDPGPTVCGPDPDDPDCDALDCAVEPDCP